MQVVSKTPNQRHRYDSRYGGIEGLTEEVSFEMGAERLVEGLLRTVGRSAFQTFGAATLKPRAPKVARTKAISMIPELYDRRERGGIYRLRREIIGFRRMKNIVDEYGLFIVPSAKRMGQTKGITVHDIKESKDCMTKRMASMSIP